MLDQAFDALKTYDWGKDVHQLDPIGQAVVDTHSNEGARKDLENRLAEVLKSGASRDAKDYVCRKLTIVGTAVSVPTLAALLADKNLSHMARYALERIPAAEAGQALRDALSKVSGPLLIGMISSLGVRGEGESVQPLAGLLRDSDSSVARAAACALGDIRTADAAKALADAKPQSKEVALAATDASLACAEAMLKTGKKAEAIALYKSLSGDSQPKHVRLAATRGILAAAGKRE
jgi:HEAT repeat protein